MVEPASARRQIGLLMLAGTDVCKIPRLHIKQSAYSINGVIVRSMRSNPEVGRHDKTMVKRQHNGFSCFCIEDTGQTVLHSPTQVTGTFDVKCLVLYGNIGIELTAFS